MWQLVYRNIYRVPLWQKKQSLDHWNPHSQLRTPGMVEKKLGGNSKTPTCLFSLNKLHKIKSKVPCPLQLHPKKKKKALGEGSQTFLKRKKLLVRQLNCPQDTRAFPTGSQQACKLSPPEGCPGLSWFSWKYNI